MAEDGSERPEPDDVRPGAGPAPRARLRTAERVALLLFGLALALLPAEIGRHTRDGGERATPPAPAPSTPPSKPSRTPPELPPPEAPAGWVIDGAGSPVSDVEVVASLADAPEETEGAKLGTTGADGKFSAAGLADGTYELSLRGGSIFPAEVRWQLPGPSVRVMVTRRHEVEGVVTANGEPAPGVEVMLSDGSGSALRATTDAKGSFRFGGLLEGLYEVWAEGKGLASSVVGVPRFGPGPHSPVEIQLEPATLVSGRVIDNASREGVVASVLISSKSGTAHDRVTTCDHNGYFTFDSVRAGRYAVEADAPGFVALSSYAVRVDPGQPETGIEVRLRRGGTAIGRVVNMRGEPVSGAELVLRQRSGKAAQSHSAVSRAQRARRFAGGPLAAAPLGHARWVHPLAGKRQLPIRPGRRFGAARSGDRPAECGRGHCGVDLGTEAGRVVHAASDGTVLSVVREARGLAGRFVSIVHVAGIKTSYMHLDHIRLDLQPGQTVRAGEPIGTVGRTGVQVSGPHLHFAMSQRRGSHYWFIDPEPMLRHAVVLPEPASLEAFEGGGHTPGGDETRTLVATLPTPINSNPLFPQPDAGEAVARRFESDADGRFSIDGLGPGTYVAWATHSELATGASKPFRIRIGKDTTDIVVELSAGVILFGRVSSERGPVAGARVVAERGKAEYAREVGDATTDDLGRYELPPLDGPVTLRVTAAGFGLSERSVSLANRTADVARRDESFVLAPADAEISGQVRDPDGFPLRGARLVISDGPSGGGRSVLTDEHGNFTLGGLSRGKYSLRITCRDYPPAKAAANTGERAALAVEQGGGVRLLVRDTHTRMPIPGVAIVAHGPTQSQRKVVADSDGRAELVPLRAGTWRFDVELSGYVHARHSVEIPPGRGPRAVSVDRAVIELARGATLAGVVRDENGDRVPGAEVSTGGVKATTDQDGHFRLVDVPTGTVTLAAKRGTERGSIELNLAPGDELVTLQISLSP